MASIGRPRLRREDLFFTCAQSVLDIIDDVQMMPGIMEYRASSAPELF